MDNAVRRGRNMTERAQSARKRRNGKPVGAEEQGEGSSAKVDQIRQIIFGSQMEEYEERFVALEKRLVDDARNLRVELMRRLDKIDAEIKAGLTNEQKVRTDDFKKTAESIGVLSQRLDSSASGLEKQVTRLAGDVAAQIEQEVERRESDLEKAKNELQELIGKRVDLMLENKADRSLIAKLLSGMATQLADEQPSRTRPTSRRK